MRKVSKGVSRRSYVKGVGTIGVACSVAGCFGGSSGDTLTYMGRGGVTQETERELMDQWSEESGIDVEHQTAQAPESLNIISENPGDIDLQTPAPTEFAINSLQYDGQLYSDLDLGEIPNYRENVQEIWLDEAPWLQGRSDALFNYISNQGIGIHKDHAEPGVDSWEDLKDPQYEDHATYLDYAPSRFANCCAALGVDVTEALQDDSVYEDVFEEMEEQHQNVFSYWTSGDQMTRFFREERAHVGSAWGGRTLTLVEEDVNVDYILPPEGCMGWTTGWAVMEESENKEACYDLLNWLFKRENMIELSQGHKYPMPLTDPPSEITELPEYTENPGDLVWVDWEQMIPRQQDIVERFLRIKAS